MDKIKFKLSIEELENMLESAKNQAEFHNMDSTLMFTIQERANGGQYLEIFQNCCYAECYPHYLKRGIINV